MTKDDIKSNIRFDRQNKRSQEKLAQFNNLKCIEISIKQKLDSQVEYYQKQLVNLYFLNIKADNLGFILLVLSFILSIVISPFVIYLLKDGLPITISSFLPFFLMIICYLIFFFLLIFISLLPSLLNIKLAFIDLTWTFLTIIGYFVGYLFILSKQGYYFNIFVEALLIAFLAECIFWLAFFITLILLATIKILIRMRRISHHPISVLIDNLILTLNDVENGSDHWVELNFKQRQLTRLEEAAKSVEYYLPRQLNCGDTITHLWLRKVSQQIATALRDKKRWILTPKEDTYTYFIESISHTLTNVLTGNWDALEQIDLEKLIAEEKLTRPQLWGSRIRSLLRATFVALLPVGIFLGIQHSPFAIPGAFSYPVIIGLIIWASLVYVVEFDPNLNTKLSMLQTLISILPPSKND